LANEDLVFIFQNILLFFFHQSECIFEYEILQLLQIHADTSEARNYNLHIINPQSLFNTVSPSV